MKTKTSLALMISLAAVGLLAGCSTGALLVGLEPGPVPPRLAPDPDGGKLLVWDKPGAFGPVPAALAAKGEAVCRSFNDGKVEYEAVGYHPDARDQNDKPFEGGGFFCVTK